MFDIRIVQIPNLHKHTQIHSSEISTRDILESKEKWSLPSLISTPRIDFELK